MMKTSSHPVFFDPERKRWRKIKVGFLLTGAVIFIIFFTLILSIILNPILASLSLPSISSPLHIKKMVPIFPSLHDVIKNEHLLLSMKNALVNARQQDRKRLNSPAFTPGKPLIIGFYVNWDDTSFNSMKDHLDGLDIVIGEWLHLKDRQGTIVEDDPIKRRTALDYIRTHRPGVKLIALINNIIDGNWNGQALGEALHQEQTRRKMVDYLVDFAQFQKLDGISIDFESIPDSAMPDFEKFLQELSIRLKTAKLQLSVNVPANDDIFNYKKIASLVDHEIVMAYDEHWASSIVGPVASQRWFAEIIKKRATDIPADKLIVALGNYGYDWTEKADKPEERTFEEAVLIAQESEAPINLDPVALNPLYVYEDESHQLHKVWFLDAVTLFNQVSIASGIGPGGYALWRLGSEDPSVWSFLGKNLPTDQSSADKLRTIKYSYDVDYEGMGEILDVASLPNIGSRTIRYNPDLQLITSSNYTDLPSPYIINRYGAAKKKIALTFDDGPDPQYTPKILDILKKENVKATFFVIGENVETYPGIFIREIKEGHEIGNHTFSHPNISQISIEHLKLEVSATERLFETLSGRGTHLFRSPYSEDSEPDTQAEAKPVAVLNDLGYLSIGMQIDPLDWQAPRVNTIVERVMDQVDQHYGNIVLLHDSGGNRRSTVAALPIIIRQLKSKGYHLVPISDLIGKTRDDIMPLSKQSSIFKWGDLTAFMLVSLLIYLLKWLFAIGIILGFFRLIFIGCLAIYQKITYQEPNELNAGKTPSVAVLVPAYNEEKVIRQTIESLLVSDHSDKFEIIVIDDGSTDSTWKVLQTHYANHPTIRLFSIINGGKSNALNFGLTQTQSDVVVIMDADTIFTRDTITKLSRHFQDPMIAAVAGNAKVGNRQNLLTYCQALEYITSQNLDRRAFTVLNCVTVVPGAVGAWRRVLVEQAGGLPHDTLAEDADLTIQLRRMGYKIVYEEEAIALTEAPDTVAGFLKQRYRWMFGTLQVTWKHRDILFRKKYGALGWFALPNLLVYQILFPFISPVMDLTLLLTLLVSLMEYLQHPLSYSSQNISQISFYYAVFMLVDFISALIGFFLEPKENKTLLTWTFVQRFFYRQLMYYVAIKCVISSLKGFEVGWNKVARKGSVVMKE